MSKLFLGNRLADLDIGEPSLPVSKVILNVDGETYYQSGDDTGATVEADCPWATQAMADSVLSQMKGFVYKPFSGYDALLDPSAELGDAITAGGHYGVLAQMGRSLDRQAAATVGAPGVDEIEDEYPYKTKQRKATDRVLAKAYSRISKTADEIRLEVVKEVGELDKQYTELKVTLDGVTITDESGTTRIKGSSIETDTLYVNAANINGTLTAGQIVLSGSITWNDLSSDVQNTIFAQGTDLPSYITSTKITETTIESPTITGGMLVGGEVLGGAYYDLKQNGMLTLSYGDGSRDDMAQLLYTSISNDTEVFEVFGHFINNQFLTVMLLGGLSIFQYYSSVGKVSLTTNVDISGPLRIALEDMDITSTAVFG